MSSPKSFWRVDIFVVLVGAALLLAMALLSGCQTNYQPPGDGLWLTLR